MMPKFNVLISRHFYSDAPAKYRHQPSVILRRYDEDRPKDLNFGISDIVESCDPFDVCLRQARKRRAVTTKSRW